MSEGKGEVRLVIDIESRQEFDLLIKRLIEAAHTLMQDNHHYVAFYLIKAINILLEGKGE